MFLFTLLYSPYCLEEVFSATRLPVLRLLGNPEAYLHLREFAKIAWGAIGAWFLTPPGLVTLLAGTLVAIGIYSYGATGLTNPPPKIELDLNCLLISLASTEAICSDSAALTSGGDSGEDTPFGGDALAGESVGDTFDTDDTAFAPSGGDSGEDTPSTGSAPSSGESGGDTPSTGSTPKTTDTEPTPPPDTHQDPGVLPKSGDPAPAPGSSSSGGRGDGNSGMAPHETPAGVGDGTKPAGAPPPTGQQTPPTDISMGGAHHPT